MKSRSESGFSAIFLPRLARKTNCGKYFPLIRVHWRYSRAIFLVSAFFILPSAFLFAQTPCYHTNRTFVPIEFNIEGTPTEYTLYSTATQLTSIVRGTNIVINTNQNQTYAIEKQSIAVGFDSAVDAWSVATNYDMASVSNHPGKVYNNVGWLKNIVSSNGAWAAYIWTLQNRIVFQSSTTNWWKNEDCVPVVITNVMVGSLGNYAPMMSNIVDIGPVITQAFVYPEAGQSNEATYQVDYTNVFYEVVIPEIWITPRFAVRCVGGSNVQFTVTGANIPNGVTWSIIPSGVGATIQTNADWYFASVSPGNIATNYKVRATSVDNTNFYDQADLAVVKIDIEQTATNVSWNTMNVTLNLTADSYLGNGTADWSSMPSGISGSGRNITFNPSTLMPTTYVVRAQSSLLTNCFDTCTMTVVEVESIELVSGAMSNNVIPPYTWATVKNTNATPEYVILKAVLNPDIGEANLPAGLVTWTGGESVAGHPLQRRVSKQTVAHTQVIATCGGTSATGDVWVIWSYLEIRMTGTTYQTPNSARFGEARLDRSEWLGAVLYYYYELTTTNIISRAAAGKVIPIGKLEPVGINAITINGWTIERDMRRHDYKDGAVWQERWRESWTNDSYTQPNDRKYSPDDRDQIYDLDAPNIAKFQGSEGIVTNSCERYDHFRQWVTWNEIKCSDYSLWYWYGRWKDNTNLADQVEMKEVGVGNPDFPTPAPHYSPP